MSATQTMQDIKLNAPEGATHYHVGLQFYLLRGTPGYHGGWYRCGSSPSGKPSINGAMHGATDEWVAQRIADGEIIVLSDIPDDMAESMPFELLQGDEEGRKDDGAKPRFDLIPPRAQESMARVLTSGAARYGDNNWKQVQPLEQRYLAAAMRHLNALARGEITDPDTGEHHGAHVMCCAAFLVEHHAILNEASK